MTARTTHERGPRVEPRRERGPARSAPAPTLLRLQAAAGNTAVAGLLARSGARPTVSLQRQGTTCPAPPVAPPGTTAAEDPRFTAATADVNSKARAAATHPPAAREAKRAQDAAVAPADDKAAQAKAAQVETMGTAKRAGFDKAAFIAAVEQAVAQQRPQTNEDAQQFSTSGKAGQIKSQVAGMVGDGKQSAARDIAEKTAQPPDPAKAVDKPVNPLPPAGAPPALGHPDAAKAMPERAPADQVELGATKCDLNAKMAGAGMTDEQLARSNEPQFTGALEAKRGAEQHAATAPAALRAEEAGQVADAKAGADAAGRAGVADMLSARTTAMSASSAAKSATKDKDEQERARIAGEISRIFDVTKTDTDKILSELDKSVAEKFDAGEQQARAAFEVDQQAMVKEYEDRRYAGIEGAAQWLVDKFKPTDPELMRIFNRAADKYQQRMKTVIADVADHIGRELDRATDRIARGRAEVASYVAAQPKSLRGIATRAAADIGGKFDSLDESVKSKQDALVQDLAEKYAAARQAIDKRVQELQDEHKSWRDKAADAIDEAANTILQMRDMLMSVLARAAGAIDLILADPIGFVHNLVNAVKGGVVAFANNIGEHLKAGLKTWLFGQLASAGIEVPEALDFKGILKLILSVLGLTWSAIRARLARHIPPRILTFLETSFEIVKILATKGLPGLWTWIKEKVGDLKEMVLGELKAMVSIEIVKAGIMWLLSLLTPTSMFVKACKAIVDIVMFVVTQASQIKEFVDSVLDSIESIARGGAGAVSGLVEKALARALPLVLGLLASLVGLGNIPPKIRATLAKAQDYVGKGIDWVVGHIVKYAKSLLARLKGKKKESNPAELEKRLDKGLSAGVGAVDRFAGRKVAGRLLHPILAVIRVRYRLTRLELVADGDTWAVEGEVNPKGSKKTSAKRPDPKELRDDIVRRLKEPWMRRGPFALGLKIQPEIPHSMGSSDHTTEEERRMFRHELGEFMSGGMKCHQCGTPIAVTDRMSVDHIPPSAILNNIPADILEDAGFYGEAARQTVNHQCRKHQAVQGGMTRVILAKYRMLLQLLAEEKK